MHKSSWKNCWIQKSYLAVSGEACCGIDIMSSVLGHKEKRNSNSNFLYTNQIISNNRYLNVVFHVKVHTIMHISVLLKALLRYDYYIGCVTEVFRCLHFLLTEMYALAKLFPPVGLDLHYPIHPACTMLHNSTMRSPCTFSPKNSSIFWYLQKKTIWYHKQKACSNSTHKEWISAQWKIILISSSPLCFQ